MASNYHMTSVALRYVAEHSVFISDETVDTNSLQSTLQVVEILCNKANFLYPNCICYKWQAEIKINNRLQMFIFTMLVTLSYFVTDNFTTDVQRKGIT